MSSWTNVSRPGYVAMEVAARIPWLLETFAEGVYIPEGEELIPDGLSPLEFHQGSRLYRIANKVVCDVQDQLRERGGAALCQNCSTLFFPMKAWSRFCGPACRVEEKRAIIAFRGKRRNGNDEGVFGDYKDALLERELPNHISFEVQGGQVRPMPSGKLIFRPSMRTFYNA